jgi:GTP-binding protein EngB required for normal cell division
MDEASYPNLFSVLEEGDRRIKKARTKAIILVGLTRVGKSTVFNWILHKPMVGKGVGANTKYINSVNEDSSVAQVGSSYSSVTLAPNIHIDYE